MGFLIIFFNHFLLKIIFWLLRSIWLPRVHCILVLFVFQHHQEMVASRFRFRIHTPTHERWAYTQTVFRSGRAGQGEVMYLFSSSFFHQPFGALGHTLHDHTFHVKSWKIKKWSNWEASFKINRYIPECLPKCPSLSFVRWQENVILW